MIGFVVSYFFWHYTRALKELLCICRNLLKFVFHFFSIDVLFKTLLSPWQRLDEAYRKGGGLSSFFETFVVNTIMRIVGLFIRLSVIIVGLSCMIIIFAIEVCTFFLWILLPFIILGFFVSGVRLLLMNSK